MILDSDNNCLVCKGNSFILYSEYLDRLNSHDKLIFDFSHETKLTKVGNLISCPSCNIIEETQEEIIKNYLREEIRAKGIFDWFQKCENGSEKEYYPDWDFPSPDPIKFITPLVLAPDIMEECEVCEGYGFLAYKEKGQGSINSGIGIIIPEHENSWSFDTAIIKDYWFHETIEKCYNCLGSGHLGKVEVDL